MANILIKVLFYFSVCLSFAVNAADVTANTDIWANIQRYKREENI